MISLRGKKIKKNFRIQKYLKEEKLKRPLYFKRWTFLLLSLFLVSCKPSDLVDYLLYRDCNSDSNFVCKNTKIIDAKKLKLNYEEKSIFQFDELWCVIYDQERSINPDDGWMLHSNAEIISKSNGIYNFEFTTWGI